MSSSFPTINFFSNFSFFSSNPCLTVNFDQFSLIFLLYNFLFLHLFSSSLGIFSWRVQGSHSIFYKHSLSNTWKWSLSCWSLLFSFSINLHLPFKFPKILNRRVRSSPSRFHNEYLFFFNFSLLFLQVFLWKNHLFSTAIFWKKSL